MKSIIIIKNSLFELIAHLGEVMDSERDDAKLKDLAYAKKNLELAVETLQVRIKFDQSEKLDEPDDKNNWRF
jgi:hypothetical protein